MGLSSNYVEFFTGMALLRFKERVVRDPLNSLSSWISEDGDLDHCSWFGINCSDGIVVVLYVSNINSLNF